MVVGLFVDVDSAVGAASAWMASARLVCYVGSARRAMGLDVGLDVGLAVGLED